MPFTNTQLQSELQTDPIALGFAAKIVAGDDAGCAAFLNALTATNVFKPSIQATDFQAALDPTEFATLTALQLNQLAVILAGGVINVGATNVRTILTNVFQPVLSFPNTRANLLNMVRRAGSRAEVLWGFGTVISHLDVAHALGRL